MLALAVKRALSGRGISKLSLIICKQNCNNNFKRDIYSHGLLRSFCGQKKQDDEKEILENLDKWKLKSSLKRFIMPENTKSQTDSSEEAEFNEQSSSSASSSNKSQWDLFKEGCYTHRVKILISVVLFLAAGSYSYAYYFNVDIDTSKNIERSLQKDTQITKVLEAFLVRTIIDVLKSPEVMNNAIDFTQDVVNQQAVHDELLKYLISGLKDPVFLEQVKASAKEMILQLLKDPDLQRDLVNLFAVG